MALPILHLDGEPYDQGRQHGSALREAIADNLDIYFERFLTEGQLPPDEARTRAAHYAEVLAGDPYLDAVRGLADGSGHSFQDVLALNMRYELLYYQFGTRGIGNPDGCTAFAVAPKAAANGHLLLGQNWDWIPRVRGAVVHTREPDGLETLGFTEAGIIGAKIGLNSTGLGLTINGLVSSADDWSRPELPFHVRCYQVLRAGSVGAARAAVLGAERPCSANFLVAQPPVSIVNIEAAPLTACESRPTDDWIVHSNHFIEPERLGITEPETERRPHSLRRQARLSALLDARRPVSLADLEACLRDHDNYPDGLCRHENAADPPEERYMTVTSAIMDLEERSLRLTDGPPCQHLYDGWSLAHMAVLGH